MTYQYLESSSDRSAQPKKGRLYNRFATNTFSSKNHLEDWFSEIKLLWHLQYNEPLCLNNKWKKSESPGCSWSISGMHGYYFCPISWKLYSCYIQYNSYDALPACLCPVSLSHKTEQIRSVCLDFSWKL